MKAQKSIPFEIIHLNEEGYHLRIAAKINSKEVSLILDSGASQTAIDQNFIKKEYQELEILEAEQVSSGIGTHSMESFECIFNLFSIGDLQIENYKASLIDLSHVNHTYHRLNLIPIHGVLGNDILLKYDAIIDYKNKQVLMSF